jgi:hypothetical protein
MGAAATQTAHMMSDSAAGGSGKSDDSAKDASSDALTANASEPAAGGTSTTATTSVKKPFDFLNKTPLSFQSILDENPSYGHFSSRPDALTSYADIGSSYRSSSASGSSSGTSSYGNSNTNTSFSQLGKCECYEIFITRCIVLLHGLLKYICCN